METKVMSKEFKIERNGTDLFVTDQYELFKTKVGNRLINDGLVKKIYDSIVENGWFASSIIIVGDGLKVLDGQHRIEALKRFSKIHGVRYKIKYIVDRDFDDLKKITTWQTARKGWTNNDYASSYIMLGYNNYQIYVDFIKRHKVSYKNNARHSSNMSHSVALMLLANSLHRNDLSKKFKDGHIMVKDVGVADIYAKRILEIGEYFPYAMDNKFVSTILSMWRNPEFNHDEFIYKLSLDRDKLYRCGTTRQYSRVMEDIYNFRRKNRVNISL